MKDGLKSDELWLGSSFSDTFSGVSLMVGTSIATAELEDSAITAAKIATNAVLSGHILANNILFGKLAAGAVSGTAVSAGGIGAISNIFAGAIDADTNTLSSGSRWVAFRQAFAAPPFVAASHDLNARTAQLAADGDWIGVGSIGTGSFLAVGSPGGYAFNWIAIGSR